MPFKYQPFKPQDYGIAPNFFTPSNTPQYQPLSERSEAGPSYQFPPDYFNFDQPNLDKFTSHLGARPKRDDYGPGSIDKILALIIGASTGYASPGSGGAAARDYLDQPYNRALEDWSHEAQSLEGLAGLDLQTSQNKAAILQAIQESDLDRLGLLLEEQRNQGQIERWRGQTKADLGRVGADEETNRLRGVELGLDRERLGMDRSKAEALEGLYESRGGYYDAMAKGKGVDEGVDYEDALAMVDYYMEPAVFRITAPLDIQEFFELDEETGRMVLMDQPYNPWGPAGPDWEGYEKAKRWQRDILGLGEF